MGGSELKLKVVAKSGAGGAVMSSLSGSLSKLASSVNQQNQMKPILRIHSSESAQVRYFFVLRIDVVMGRFNWNQLNYITCCQFLLNSFLT